MAQQSSDKVAVVTGANKGLGLSLVRVLCKSNFPGVVYLTSRDETRGQAALEQLKAEGLNPRFHQLDIASSESIRRFADHVKNEHGGVDVLIANASIPFSPGMTVEQVEEAIRTNNKGNAELCATFLPMFRPNGRLVIVSSGFGTLVHLGPQLKQKFLDTDHMTVDDLHKLLDEYLQALREGNPEEKGWPDWANKVSKIALVALARILHHQTQKESSKYPGLMVNAACPGWTVTDASKPYLDQENKFGDVQAKMPDDAAVDVVWLATLPPGTSQPNGQLVQYRTVIAYEG